MQAYPKHNAHTLLEELSDLGTFSLEYEFDANETVTVLFGVEAYADVVPVPGTGLLLSAGLMILAAVRRKG